MNREDEWSPLFYKQSPIFDPVKITAQSFNAFSSWPQHKDYNLLLSQTHKDMTSLSGAELTFVPQAGKPQSVYDEYETRIFKSGEIQTRLHNWHDYFQVLAWCSFPEIKKTINHLHTQALIKRKTRETSKQRSPVENALTLFDECGAIIVSCNDELINLIKDFSWKELFITNRSTFEKEIKCITFGHALYEKSMSPYIGMTAHSIIIKVSNNFFNLDADNQYNEIDTLSANYFSQLDTINTSILQPFPILGVPGWDVRNNNPEYYDNEEYFRRKRKK